MMFDGTIMVNGKVVFVAVAHEDPELFDGMRGIEPMDGFGMLFWFNKPKRAGMWMKDVKNSLDLAFIREDGTISQINTMPANSTEIVESQEPVPMALEVPAGWFAKNKVSRGDVIHWIQKTEEVENGTGTSTDRGKTPS